ncbi:MAG: CdaR family protein [Defluviitaleaceae bacterium]|nr:CdaR family protein [Defluviitaleaceae bacterium]
MVKKFFSMLFSDFQWKVLSLLAALVLWLVGMNLSNPPQTISVTPRLRLDNLGILSHERVMLINEDTLREMNIQVGVHGLRSDIDILRVATPARLAQILEVSIDFRSVDIDAVHESDWASIIPLRVSTNFLESGFEHVFIDPPYVLVHLDVVETVNLPVTVVPQGTTSLNFEVQPITLANNRVSISGSRSVLQMVESIRAFVDVTGIHSEEDMTVQLLVYDSFDNNISDMVHRSVTETTAVVRVWPVQPMDIRVRGSGTLAPGFAVAGAEPVPGVIRVVGAQDVLDELEYISIEIDWSGASGDMTLEEDLTGWLPQGVHLYRGESPYIDIYVTVEPIETRTFSIPRGEVRTWGGTALYEVVGYTPNILVLVNGPSSLVSNLTAASIGLGLDLRGLPVGTHTVPLIVTVPPGVSFTAPLPMMVQIHAPAVAGDDNDDYITLPPLPPPPELLPDNGYHTSDEPYNGVYTEYPDNYPYADDYENDNEQG